MKRRERLFRGGNQVFVCGLVFTLSDLVQLFIELLQLCSLGHELFQHELWGLVGFITLVEQEFQPIVDESQVEEETIPSQAVASVPNDLYTALGVITIQASKNFMVGEAVGTLQNGLRRSPVLDDFVVILLANC